VFWIAFQSGRCMLSFLDLVLLLHTSHLYIYHRFFSTVVFQGAFDLRKTLKRQFISWCRSALQFKPCNVIVLKCDHKEKNIFYCFNDAKKSHPLASPSYFWCKSIVLTCQKLLRNLHPTNNQCQHIWKCRWNKVLNS